MTTHIFLETCRYIIFEIYRSGVDYTAIYVLQQYICTRQYDDINSISNMSSTVYVSLALMKCVVTTIFQHSQMTMIVKVEDILVSQSRQYSRAVVESMTTTMAPSVRR
jgi:hypothetical protein